MNKLTILLMLGALLLAGGIIRLYLENGRLSEEIAAYNTECEQKLAAFAENKQAELDELRDFLAKHYHYKKTENAQKTKKPGFTEFLSYGHRVRAVESKYEFILQTALISDAEKKNLRKVLIERERIASMIEQRQNGDGGTAADLPELESELAEIEARIQIILQDDVDYIRYLALRERHL